MPFAPCQSARARHPLSTNAAALANFGPRRRRSTDVTADRLTNLEIRAAEQERTIEELSGQIAEQWKTIDALKRRLDALTERFLTLEEQAAPDVPVTKPPHW